MARAGEYFKINIKDIPEVRGVLVPALISSG